MDNNYNVLKFCKIDSAKAFVEVTEAFGIEKIKVSFRQYDKSKEAGSRVNVSIDIYLDKAEARRLASLILEPRFIRKMGDQTPVLSKVQEGHMRWEEAGRPSKGSFYASPPGGTSKDGAVRFRMMKILPADKADYRIAAFTGPGKKDEKGLIHLDGEYDGYVYVPVSEESLITFGHALEDAANAMVLAQTSEWMRVARAQAQTAK